MRITCETKDTLSLSALTEFQGGLKKRTADDTKKIEKSINDYGFATPFFVWRHDGINSVLDGHGRLQTLKEMQKRGEEIPALPVVYIDCANEAAAKNLLLRICSTYGEMTAETVKEFLGELKIDFTEIALPDGIIDLSILTESNETKGDDDAPVVDTKETPDSVRGGVYELGEHKLICGDSTDPEVLRELMGGTKADLIITDPPYNVDYTGKTKEELKIDNDKKSDAQFFEFLKNAYNAMFGAAKAGAAFYIFYAQLNSDIFINALKAAGYKPHQYLVWVKNVFTLSYADYKWKHEPIMYGWKDGDSHRFYGALNESTVIDERKEYAKMTKRELVEAIKEMERRMPADVIYEKKPARNAEHPTMKPVELLTALIKNSTKSEDIILDPFGGSGSTLIAAAKTGRTAKLCELDPHYCDVIRKRWTKWAKENGYEVGNGVLV